MANLHPNVFINLCDNRTMNSNFFFSLKVRELINKNPEHLYEVDDSNKDILSIILRQMPNHIKLCSL